VHDLDSIDMGILRDLRANCRTTYQTMSQRYGISANAIRNRVERLQEKGFIASFVLLLSPAMADASPFFALAYSSYPLDDAFVNEVGNHRLVNRVGSDSYGSCVISGYYRIAEDLSEFNEFIRGFESIRDCEIHPIPMHRGGATELSTLHLKVIRSLRDNPRKSIANIADESGLTARRVRSILNKLIENEIIRLTIRVNPNAGDTIWISYRIRWDPRVTSGPQICNKLRGAFPNQYFQEIRSATESLMWTDFLVEKMSDSENVTNAIKSIPSARVENTIIPFSGRFFSGLLDSILDEFLKNAGLL
jgi:DNA-binding Lrp family transcriptional regulator